VNNHLHTSNAGIDLITSFEGCRLHPYRNDGDVWTIGYGHTHNVGPHTPALASKAAARKLLAKDLVYYEDNVKKLVRVRLSQHQFDALVSLNYNLGPGVLSPNPKISHFGWRLSQGRFARAANRMLDWSDPGTIFHAGILRRRRAERALFLRGSNRRTRIAARTGVR
jgi:lysozyme